MNYKRIRDVVLTSSVIQFFICTSILNIVYLLPSTLTLHQNHGSIDLDKEGEKELNYIVFETVMSVIFKSFIDLQINIYFVLNGCLGFFYLFIAMLITRIIRYVIIEAYTIPSIDLFLYLFYIICNSLRIIISFLWIHVCRNYITRRNSQVCDNNISASITYYSVYYTLEGCSLIVINYCIYSVFLAVYEGPYISFSETINVFWTGVIACAGWYFLWIDKKYIQQKWFMCVFYLLNVIRVVVIYIRSGEIRIYLNIYYREATVSERLYRLLNPDKYHTNKARYLFLNFLDNSEYFIIGIVYNVYFIWYCIILYRLKGASIRIMEKHRIPIEKPEIPDSLDSLDPPGDTDFT